MMMRLHVATLMFLAFIGCASGDAELASRGTLTASTQCTQVHNIDFPSGTKFPAAVAFRVGTQELPAGDSITITEVRGTRDRLEVGGIYWVRGHYTLNSADAGTLQFNVTATEPGEGCTEGNPHGLQTIARGSGSFELATRMVYVGRPHVWFDGQSARGVYFDNAQSPMQATPQTVSTSADHNP
jgi:hypothetical protein